jgi:general secretion pathway protein F
MQFTVRALSPENAVSNLELEAPDASAARRQMETRGWTVVSISSAAGSTPATAPAKAGGRSKFSLSLFSEALHALMSAGLALPEALEALAEREAQGGTRIMLEQLLRGLQEGQRFSDTLAAQPALFPPLYIGIMRAAEGTSDLPRALQRYIDYQKQVDTVRGKLISAAIYPVILLSVGGAVSLFLMTYVVPRFASVYQGRGGDLPWMSRMMLAWGEFAAAYPLLLAALALGVVAALAIGVPQAIRSGAAARALARLPGVGARLHLYELARLYLTLGMLLEGGIPLITAMDTAAGVASTRLKRAIAMAREAISDGGSLADAFDHHGLATPISLRLLRVGERSGNLGTMLLQSAQFHDGEFSRWIERFSKMVEPMLMAVIGLVVGAIVILLYMPIFDLAGSFN